MSFQISKTAQDWFKKINNKSPFDTSPNMDFYYMCFLLGINSTKQKQLNEPEDGKPFIAANATWPGLYKDNSKTIIAMLLESELENFSIDRRDKDAVKAHLNKYLKPSSPFDLTDNAIKIMDNYSYTGFLELQEEIHEAPSQVNVFLSQYHKVLTKYLS